MTPALSSLKPPRLVAWETTRACNLLCRHCRAAAIAETPPDELSAQQGRDLLRQLAAWSPAPLTILSGGEPLLRPDIVELAAYGSELGLRMLLSTNGSLVTAPKARELKKAGLARVSLSLDGAQPASHDLFRGLDGSFAAVVQAAAYLREAGLPFQINSTLSAVNLAEAEALSRLAESLGAAAHHVFLLVPVGRGEELASACVSADQYEELLVAMKKREASLSLEFKATCAPQYQRIGRQLNLAPAGPHGAGRGCLAGQGFMFISSVGQVQGCGYLDLSAGQIQKQGIREIYESSPVFAALRDRSQYRGKCGRCEYFQLCGGCRARAKAAGDYLGPEPLCPYEPGGGKGQ